MKNWSHIVLPHLIAFCAGATLTAAFAPYGLFPFAILAPATLLYLWLKATPGQAFRLGFIFGLGFFGTGIYWLYTSIHLFGDIPNLLAGSLTFAVIALFAIFPGLVGYYTTRYFPATTTLKLVFAFPAIWLASEWIRSWAFTGFPWLFVGYSQTNSVLKGYAPILSVYGVSLACTMCAGLMVNTWLAYRAKNQRAILQSSGSFIAIWIVGTLLALIPWTEPQGKPLELSLVQGNIPQSLKWDPEHIKLSFDRYETMTESLWGKDKIIIWPEAAIPMPLNEATAFIEAMNKKATDTGSTLIFGIPIQANAVRDTYFNSIVTLGTNKQVYTKHRLVPFGEYLPMEQIALPVLNKLGVPAPNTAAGKINQDPLTIGQIKVLATICYEIAFPELVRTPDKSIGFLLTLTNDAWFGVSSAQAQHLQMSAMRAIELARPAVFVSNDGITAIINANGKIETAAPAHEVAVLNGRIQPTYGLTPWMKNGVEPLIFIVFCMLIAAARANRRASTTLFATESTNHK